MGLQSLIQPLIDQLLQKLKDLFAPVLKPLTKLWGILKGFFTALVQVVPKAIHLFHSIIDEVQAWKTFKKNISFKTGVVSLQSARARIEDLIGEIVDAWNSIQDFLKEGLHGSVGPFKAAGEAAAELADLFEGLGKFGLKDFLEEIGPKLEKIGGKVFEVLAIVQSIAEKAVQIIDEIQTVVDAIKDVRETFQTGEGLFLQQKNARKTLTLQDGGKIKIRIGSLHDS